MLFWPNKTCWDVSVASGNCEKMCKNLSSVIVNLIIGTDWTIDDIISTKCQPEESNLTRRTYFVTIFEPQMSNFLLFAAISPCTFDARLPRLIIKVWLRALSWALEGLWKSWRALFTHLWHFIHENNRSIHEYNLQPQPCSPPPLLLFARYQYHKGCGLHFPLLRERIYLVRIKLSQNKNALPLKIAFLQWTHQNPRLGLITVTRKQNQTLSLAD